MKLSSVQIFRSLVGALACAAIVTPSLCLAQTAVSERAPARFTYVETKRKQVEDAVPVARFAMQEPNQVSESISRPPFEDEAESQPSQYAGPLDHSGYHRSEPAHDRSTSPQLAPEVDQAAFATGNFAQVTTPSVRPVAMQQPYAMPVNRRQDPSFSYVTPNVQSNAMVPANFQPTDFVNGADLPNGDRSFVDVYANQYRAYPTTGRSRITEVDPASVCDRWSCFTNCGTGLKANPGHWGLPWLRSNEPCETTVGCDSGCKKGCFAGRGNGCKERGCRSRQSDCGCSAASDCGCQTPVDNGCDCGECGAASSPKRGLFQR